MPTVTLHINNRSYVVPCDVADVERVRALGARIDGAIAEMIETLRLNGEESQIHEQMLIMASLTFLDQADDQAAKQVATEEALCAAMDAITARVEGIALAIKKD